MLLKDRTKKRLRWFLAGIVVVGCAGVVAYFVRDRVLENRAVASREAGMKHLEAGEYFQALHAVGTYVRRHPEDVEALFAYAKARQEVPEPNNRHIADAIGLLRRVTALSPTHVPAAEALLELYQKNGLLTEALQLSQDLLGIDPKNRVAMKAKATALFAGAKAPGTKPEDALDVARDYNALWPGDVDGQLLTMDILNRGDAKRERAVAHFDALREKSPNDPLAVLLVGVAHLSAGDNAVAAKMLAEAAKMNMPDAAAVRLLVRNCDQLEMFEHSMDVLKRHAARGGDQSFVALLAGRLWELDSYEELARQFDGKVGKDAQPAALRCLALRELGQKEQALAALDALKKASASNTSARDWAAVIEPILAGPAPNDAAVITACHDALRSQNNPYVRFLLAEAYLRTGDADAAVQAWLQVREMAPAWPAPFVRLGHLTAAAGDGEKTILAAQQALKRAPNNTRALLMLAAAKTARLKTDPSGAQEALALLDRVAQQSPKEESLRPLRVRALAYAGRQPDAAAEARRALDPAAAAPASVLIPLAAVSEELKLGLEQEILAHCERAYGVSPQLALAKANKEFAAGRKAEAVQLFEKARAAAPAGKELEWETTRASLLEAAGDPRAKEAWVALADANPSNAQLQWACVSAASVQKDRALTRRLLDRLKEQFGNRGLRWRLAHAQWLFAGRRENAQNAVEAALVLNELTREAPNTLAPRLLLAECQLHLGQVAGAIEQLTAAAQTHPGFSEIPLNLARLLQSRGETSRARGYLDEVIGNRAAPFAHVRDAAELIDAQGDTATALAVLERAYGPALKDPPADLLLANLYRKTNQPQRVEAICKRLLESGDVQAIAFVSDFYAAQGRAAEAAAALQRLEAVQAKPGERELVLGSHALRSGDPARAEALFTAATRAAPSNPAAWRQLIRFHLRGTDDEKVMATARAAEAALGGDEPGLAAFLRQQPAAMKLQSKWPETRAMWGDLIDVPAAELPFIEVAGLLPPETEVLGDSRLDRLATLASKHPSLTPLQLLASRALLSGGRRDDAVQVALRAAQGARDKAVTAPFAAMTLAHAGRWPEVLEMARQWRLATPTNTLPADQLIADAHVAMGNPAAARDQLAPHMTRAAAEPEKFGPLIARYAELQAQAASPAAAAELLRPRLATGGGWRVIWMTVARNHLAPADALAWLTEVEPLAAKGEMEERLALAESWHVLAKRSQDPAHAAHAAELLAGVMGDPRAKTLPPSALVVVASMQESQGNGAAAEATYREALALDPQLAVAQNNLAMILATKAQSLDEALALAQQAVSSPTAAANRAGMYDTLAFVQAQRGDYTAAVAAMQQALRLKPNEPKYQVRLAGMLIENQQVDRARAIFDELKSISEPSPDLKKQIESLQQRLERTSSARAS